MNPLRIDMARSTKVLLLTKGLGLGGMERLLAESIRHLDRGRYEYEVGYFLPWKDDLVPEFEQAGIPVHSLGIGNDRDLTAPRKLRALFKSRGVDLVHSHSPHPAAVARVASLFTGVRALVHTEHSLPDSRNAASRIANRITYPLNDLTIAVSNDVAVAIDSGVFRPRRLRVIHGGIDQSSINGVHDADVAAIRSSLGIPEGNRVVGNLAHLRSQKGLDVFLEAAATIARARPDTSFILVGREKEAGFQSQLEVMADRLGIGERVVFTGFQKDPYPFLAAFDVFMMSSHYEGFPIALIEAMAMGKAVVTTNVGGVGEAVAHGDNGLLVEAGDSSGLAELTLGLLGDPAERSRLGDRARRTVLERYSIQAMVESVEAAYEEVL